MNPNLARLRPCPFEKLRQPFVGVTPNPTLREITLSIGEAQHATPAFFREALIAALGGLASYPTTCQNHMMGQPAIRPGHQKTVARPLNTPEGEESFVCRSRDFHIELVEAT